MTTAGGNFEWLARLLHGGEVGGMEEWLRKLDAEAASADPTAGGLLFLPYLSGERCPFSDPHARASSSTGAALGSKCSPLPPAAARRRDDRSLNSQ